MGDVVRFRHAGTLGARAAAPRAAKVANNLRVTPARFATFVEVIETHHSDGICPRWTHFKTVGSGAPQSSANARRVDQRAMTSRKEAGLRLERPESESAIPKSLGQIVLKNKDSSSYDKLPHGVQHHRMAEQSSSEFEKAFIDRTKWARQSAGLTQLGCAEMLGIQQDRYKHFETSRMLTNELVGRFCMICAIDPNWLFTQKGRGPALSREAAEERMPSRSKRSA